MMKMKFLSAILIAGLGIALISCNNSPEQASQTTKTTELPSMHTVKVDSVIQGTQYTYLKLDENNNKYWVATAKAEFNPGETLYYEGGLEMNNFTSKEVGRTFDKLLLVQEFSREPGNMASQQAMPEQYDHSKSSAVAKEEINVKPAEGGITIAELYANPKDYDGKTVKVRGKVTKVNTGIMGRNWIHIQDGTSNGNNYDLTITTDDIAQDGATVTFEGTISLNKDFGAGYTYPVIMENAKKLKDVSQM